MNYVTDWVPQMSMDTKPAIRPCLGEITSEAPHPFEVWFPPKSCIHILGRDGA